MWLFRAFSGEGPFFSGGKPRAAATSETGVGNFFDDIFGVDLTALARRRIRLVPGIASIPLDPPPHREGKGCLP
jgi:hypothetical protein